MSPEAEAQTEKKLKGKKRKDQSDAESELHETPGKSKPRTAEEAEFPPEENLALPQFFKVFE